VHAVGAFRFSPTGEGLFLFNTTEASSIYSKIRVVTHRMADARRIASRSIGHVSVCMTKLYISQAANSKQSINAEMYKTCRSNKAYGPYTAFFHV